jgi:hypothetical protein
MTYSTKHQYRLEMARFCEELRCDYFITVATNVEKFPFRIAEGHIRHIDAVLNRHWLGCNWARCSADQRSLMVAFPELGHQHTGADSFPLAIGEFSHPGFARLHYHLLMRVPPEPRYALNRNQIAGIVSSIWKRRVPSGSSLVSFLTSDDQRRRTASYCTKEFTTTGVGIENWIVLPRRAGGVHKS